ncbi:MAG TPA: hypothetical protein ENK98_00255 [Epsilonproteobacteria bacterium]|nr:hypothetical protein [Campylobacterota bacterium]
MKSISGEIKLDRLIDLTKEKVEESTEYRNRPKSNAVKKLEVAFYEMLFLKPLLFYVPKGTLVSSNSYDEFEKFVSDIFYIDDIYTLILCMNLSIEKMKNYSVKWIICEAEKKIQKSRVFQQVPFLDYYMSRKKDGSNSTSGKLDFIKLDQMYFDNHKKADFKKYLRKAGEYFYTNIFSLNLTERKDDYAIRELKYFKRPSEIEYSDKDIEKLYNYTCPICEAQHQIWLIGNEKSNVKECIKLNDEFVEFECDHENTDFEGIAKFGFNAIERQHALLTDEQYNQAFLYLFYRAKHNKGDMEYKDQEGKIQKMSIAKYNEKRSAGDR